MTKEDFFLLIDKHLNGLTTDKEKQQLINFTASFQKKTWNKDVLGDPLLVKAELYEKVKNSLHPADSSFMSDPESVGDASAAGSSESTLIPSGRRIHFLKVTWFRYAAVLLLIAGTAAFLYFNNNSQKEILSVAGNDPEKATDIQPGGNKALLTLTDGSTIVLDSAGSGELAQQGNMQVVKLASGQLAYHAKSPDQHQGRTQINAGRAGQPGRPELVPESFNTISTPKGGEYQVILPDGSRVWLNAASSIHFPTSFLGKERKVTVTGESYFEVAPNNTKPFIVRVNDMEVKVLGTSFNVNAYEDEKTIKTTLVNGAINVSVSNKTITLRPGQQASVKGTVITTNGSIDINQETAWRKGLFIFNETPIEPIMRQLARWYNLEVVYEGKVKDLFVVTIPRNVPVSQVLEVLQQTKAVHFKIDGNRIIVSG